MMENPIMNHGNVITDNGINHVHHARSCTSAKYCIGGDLPLNYYAGRKDEPIGADSR